MFDTTLLEIAIGLSFVYLLLSLVVSTLFEALSTWARFRSKDLWQGVRLLLSAGSEGDGFARQFMAHPIVRSLSSPSNVVDASVVGQKTFAPSHLPPPLFATALLDAVGVGGKEHQLGGEIRRIVAEFGERGSALELADKVGGWVGISLPNLPGSKLGADLHKVLAEVTQQTTLGALKDRLLTAVGRSSAEALQSSIAAKPVNTPATVSASSPAGSGAADSAVRIPAELIRVLSCFAAESGSDFPAFRQRVEAWFDEGMNRASGWYRRRAQYLTLVLAAAVALLMNVDTLAIVRKLGSDSALRRSLVAKAETFAEENRGRFVATPAGDEKVEPVPKDMAAVKKPSEVTLTFTPNPVVAGFQAIGTIRNPLPASLDLNFGLAIQGTNSPLTVSTQRVFMASGRSETTFFVTVPPTNRPYAAVISITNGTPVHAILRVQPDPQTELNQLQSRIDALGLPLGWSLPMPGQMSEWVEKFLGWALTAIAISLGAPFWFDAMTKLLKLRPPSHGPVVPTVPKATGR